MPMKEVRRTPLNSLKHTLRLVLGLTVAGRRVTVFPDDTFLVSYPRSGNTWTRFLISHLLSPGKEFDSASLANEIPNIYSFGDRALKRVERPRVLKSHESYDPRYLRVIYLVRDPRDVVVSYFHYRRRMGELNDEASLFEFAERFMKGQVGNFGSWSDHVTGWLSVPSGNAKILMVKYEDLIEDTIRELRRISEFLALERTDTEFRSAVELSQFERLRRLEAESSGKFPVKRKVHAEVPFFRKGRRDGWKKEISPDLADQIVHTFRSAMETAGYL